MYLKDNHIKLITGKIIGTINDRAGKKFDDLMSDNARFSGQYRLISKIWEESSNARIFNDIDTKSDWNTVKSKIGHTVPVKEHHLKFRGYLVRIAAVVILGSTLTTIVYKAITSGKQAENGHTTLLSDNQVKNVILPDGSTVALNAGSTLSFAEGYGNQSREVVLEGEAFFNVIHNPSLPFKVFAGETVVEVTGTSFSVMEEEGKVRVSVVSGTVKLSTVSDENSKISVEANQSAFILSNKEIIVEEGIPVNNLSWKTGHLVFDETPIDSALMDIAHHFRKDLSIESSIKQKITAEFQGQPLYEILDELELVAGLVFDTTGTSLIVRK